MRLVLAGGTFLAFLWLPHLARGALVSRGTPRLLFWFGLLSLSGISAAFVGLLVAMVSPEPANVASFPRVVEICVDAATRLLAHPLGHWPSIVAALLLGFLVRAATGWAQTFRDSRRARPPRGDLPGERIAKRRYLGRSDRDVRVLPSDEPVAYTVGLLRPRTVLSVGLDGGQLPREGAAQCVWRHGSPLAIALTHEPKPAPCSTGCSGAIPATCCPNAGPPPGAGSAASDIPAPPSTVSAAVATIVTNRFTIPPPFRFPAGGTSSASPRARPAP